MNSFITGIDEFYSMNGKQRGENGMVEWTDEGLGDQTLAIFNQSVRGMSSDKLKEMISKAFVKCEECSESQIRGNMVADLIVLAFQIRNCRGGKGEKAIFLNMFKFLFDHYPSTMLSLLDLVPMYGYYKDYLLLLESFPAPADCNEQQVKLRDSIIEAIVTQLRKDEDILKEYEESMDEETSEKKPPSISMLAKFMPRKNTHFAKGENKWIFKMLLHSLFPGVKHDEKLYRHLTVKLTAALNVPEVFMCAQRYEEIKFTQVPSLCMNRFRKAFLNEKAGRNMVPLTEEEEETGNRFPDVDDRVKARKNLLQVLTDQKMKKLNGKQLHPHELVSKFQYSYHRRDDDGISKAEKLVFQSQWDSMKEGVLESMNKLEEGALDLGKLVPLVDVSGSMTGTPMEVAIALGILVSEVNHPSFRNRFITFETNPKWVTFEENWSLAEKVLHTRKAPWGGSTDIAKAFEMIYNVVEENELSEEEIPNLIIFSDMQFNCCTRYNETMYQRIERKFARLGKSISGKPYGAPLIIFWNLRSTGGHAVQASTKNTMLLSGFSPSMLSLILQGQKLEGEEEVDENGNLTKKSITPWETMRLALDNEAYFPVRSRLATSDEGYLQYYEFDNNENETEETTSSSV